MNATLSNQTADHALVSTASPSEATPAEFTEQDIRAAYAKTRTGADFPRLIQDLKRLGIVSHDHMLESGSNVFHGKDCDAHASVPLLIRLQHLFRDSPTPPHESGHNPDNRVIAAADRSR